MIIMLKKSMWQELEEFGLLPMNRADYRHSWTYSFDVTEIPLQLQDYRRVDVFAGQKRPQTGFLLH